MIKTTNLIDLKWAEIDGEWVIYEDELKEWVRSHGTPHCPVCKDTRAGMKNIRVEGNIKRGNCAKCGSRLAIIKGAKSNKQIEDVKISQIEEADARRDPSNID